jgi:8-oxo-dGTP diphosphatase
MRRVQRNIVSALIFSKEGKLLQVKNSHNQRGVYSDCWLIPGGGVEDGEEMEEALNREVLEEVGIDISHSSKTLVWTGEGESIKTLKDTGEEVIVEMKFNNYKVELKQIASKIKVTLSEEHNEHMWIDVSELKNLKLSPPSIECFTQLGYL